LSPREDNFTATLSSDLSHLDSEAHPYDLMNTTLQTEEAIESRSDGLLPGSASLLADENFVSNLILNNIGNNFTIRQTGFSQITTTKFIDIDNGISENASGEKRFAKFNTSKISFFEPRVVHSSSVEEGILEVGSFHRGSSNLSTIQIGSTQISLAQIDIFNDSIGHLRSTQINPTQIDTKQTSLRQIDSTEINSTQTDILQLNSPQISTTKIPFASGISSEQLFSIHNSTPEIINALNNSATKIWSDLLKPKTFFDLNFQIKDLPTGQLAESTITSFDDSGVPNGGTIYIDSDANNKGWFIDPTPSDNSEFTDNEDIDINTQIIAVNIPNEEPVSIPDDPDTPDPTQWYTWITNIDEIETLTGLDLLSNLSDELENQIPQITYNKNGPIDPTEFPIINLSTPLLAKELDSPVTSIRESSIAQDSISNSGIINSSRQINRGFTQVNTSQISPFQQGFTPKLGSLYTGISQISSNKSTVLETGFAKIGFSEIGIIQPTTLENSATQIGSVKVGSVPFSFPQIGVTQINPTQIAVTQIDSIQTNPREVSFTSSIPSEQFFSIHNSTSEVKLLLMLVLGE
jgi:hypothetical protein